MKEIEGEDDFRNNENIENRNLVGLRSMIACCCHA